MIMIIMSLAYTAKYWIGLPGIKRFIKRRQIVAGTGIGINTLSYRHNQEEPIELQSGDWAI
jgi:hypothetical protein